jgi:hypothetical protein
VRSGEPSRLSAYDGFRHGEDDAVGGDPQNGDYPSLDACDGRGQVPGADAQFCRVQLRGARGLLETKMPPMPFEYQGREAAARFFSAVMRGGRGCRQVATRANGQPSCAMYRQGSGHRDLARERPAGSNAAR